MILSGFSLSLREKMVSISPIIRLDFIIRLSFRSIRHFDYSSSVLLLFFSAGCTILPMEHITILYEDKEIIVCVKPAGVLSESGGMPEALAAQGNRSEIFCVHRLDRAVGGVMVYAKTERAAAALSASMARGRFHKEYLAVVPGCPGESSGTLRDLLFKDSRCNKTYVVKSMRKGVREAVLNYSVAESRDDMSLVRIRLQTGRSHQIRVQFASRAMPLVGDVKYGSRFRDCGIALWSYALSFPHPDTGKTLSFSCPPEQVYPWSRFNLKAE